MNPILYIGIDTGTKTGFAVWKKDLKSFISVETLPIHTAMEHVLTLNKSFDGAIIVRVEDARQRTFYGHSGREKLQGAGSVKRDATIWEDFLKDKGIPYEMVAPKNNMTKLDAQSFAQSTGWTQRTSNHGRDAAMLVYGF